ncbi:MAG TPA: HU family DNA-binding protein [Acidimicrobiales bacterium]|nr:HU family DNA-binding protein [Acidimicrobiales bacterium]
MNKSGLIDAISDTTSLTRGEAEDAVKAFVHAVVSEVRGGRRVAVVGFGSFNPTQRGARTGRNPQTGAPVKIAAAKGVRFSPSSTLKGIVNGKAPLPALKVSSAPAEKATEPAAKKVLKNAAKKSTKKAVRSAPAKETNRKPVAKIVRRSPATTAAKRAPARKTAKRSANKAVRRAPATSPAKRAPARKAAKRSAKKAVRRRA